MGLFYIYIPLCFCTAQKLDDFLNEVMSRGLIGDGTLAPDITKVIVY